MSIDWGNTFIYLFPPFSMIWPILTKIEADKVEKALIVVPKWPTQSWYPRIMQLCLSEPILIHSTELQLPGTTESHPLAPKLRLLALLCSSQAGPSPRQQRNSYKKQPGTVQNRSTNQFKENGDDTAYK